MFCRPSGIQLCCGFIELSVDLLNLLGVRLETKCCGRSIRSLSGARMTIAMTCGLQTLHLQQHLCSTACSRATVTLTLCVLLGFCGGDSCVSQGLGSVLPELGA